MKEKSTISEYKSIKKDIKKLLITTKNSSDNLEVELLAIRNRPSPSDKSDLRHLFDLLTTIENNHQIKALFLTENEEGENKSNALYMHKEQVEKSFDDKGKQLSNLTMTIGKNKHDELRNTISKAGYSTFKTSSQSEKCITIVIQRSSDDSKAGDI